jgi:hypothetical protein
VFFGDLTAALGVLTAIFPSDLARAQLAGAPVLSGVYLWTYGFLLMPSNKMSTPSCLTNAESAQRPMIEASISSSEPLQHPIGRSVLPATDQR